MQDDLEQRVQHLITQPWSSLEAARAIIPMVLEHAAKAVENQRPVHHSFVRRTHAAAAIRAIGAP
jgi:hypothetical protein